LVKSALSIVEAQERLKNNGMGKEDRVIDQTFIGQINILLQRPGDQREGIPDFRDSTEIIANEIPELPAELESGGEAEDPDIDGGGSQE
jgi:hypothetical protein